ncbi:CAP domain-containing protein [bacterium]|nr:CAP domain-containing protein [bacterium]
MRLSIIGLKLFPTLLLTLTGWGWVWNSIPPTTLVAAMPGPVGSNEDEASSGGNSTGVTINHSPGLDRLNFLRSLANLPPVWENLQFNQNLQLHCQWIVNNNDLAHSETPGSPWFTDAGNLAAEQSNLTASSAYLTITKAVDGFITAPFHALGMLDPRLQQTGFGLFNSANAVGDFHSAAGVNVLGACNGPTDGIVFPVIWPANGKTVPFTKYPGNEYPDPLTSTPGFTSPAGLPLILQFAGQTPIVSGFSLVQRGGAAQELAEIDARNYTNPSASCQSLVRSILGGRHAVILIPRLPLRPGATYDASIVANGVITHWSFKVDAAAVDRYPVSAQVLWPL